VNYIREDLANRIVQHLRRNYKTTGLAVALAVAPVAILAANADTSRSDAASAQRSRQIPADAASGPEPARSEPKTEAPKHKQHIPEVDHVPDERPEQRKDNSPGWTGQRLHDATLQTVKARQDRLAPHNRRPTPYATAKTVRGRGLS